MGKTPTDGPTRCPECGFRIGEGGRPCPMCGTSRICRPPSLPMWEGNLIGGLQMPDVGELPSVQTTASLAGLPMAAPAGRLQAPSARGALTRPPGSLAQATLIQIARTPVQGADVTGRVIAVEHSHTEPPGFDACRALTKLLWFLLLFPVVAAVAVPLILLRCFSGTDLLWLGFFFRGNGRASEQVPVWYARLRRLDDDGEVMVRLKGAYSTGNVAADDLVSFWGSWRDGVLVARRGFNHRTRSRIAFRSSQWRVYLVLTLALIAGMAIYLCAVWPHFASQAGR